ncbi:SDR16C5 [Lepeophtheirus salmonis]|uniref:SDR16C5 n=1 Tax=Lepeophtheirus salmonis TaxID=72036 RepID=A0A7R8CS69_LEPSM|nr:SDR16C5 [Lepeophtheirus salmonis]CAF2911861.1 SDR16C5 [Lepeophtheirus salmonis]
MNVQYTEEYVDSTFFPRFALIIYRINILIFDIFIFLISAILEYARLIYRYFIPRERKSIEGLNALVTGAGNGIGRQLAIELARNGANIVCLDFLINENEETSAEIKKQFPNIKTWTVTCDVSVHLNVQYFQVSLWVLRAILPQMIARDTGYVVAMASFAGHAGVPNMVPYTASKFGIKGMMEALFIELRQGNRAHGIHLMTVSPFLVDTGMIKNRRVRFPDILDIETPERAAEVIISNMRQGNAIVFIPNILYYLMSIIRILPSRVQLLITDFLDSGIGVDYDQQ